MKKVDYMAMHNRSKQHLKLGKTAVSEHMALFDHYYSLQALNKLHRINQNKLNKNKIHSSWNLYLLYTTQIQNIYYSIHILKTKIREK